MSAVSPIPLTDPIMNTAGRTVAHKLRWEEGHGCGTVHAHAYSESLNGVVWLTPKTVYLVSQYTSEIKRPC